MTGSSSGGSNRDVGRFNSRANSYDKDFLGRHYHRGVHEAMVGVIESLPVAPRSILDVGCGTGSLLALLGERLPETTLTGVDPASEMLRVARERLGDANPVRLQQARAEKLPFADRSFDLAVTSNSFHHWTDQAAGVGEIARVLVPGGYFVITDPFAIGLRKWIRFLRWLGRLRTDSEVEAMLGSAGLELVEWRPVRAGGPFTNYFLIARVPATGTTAGNREVSHE